ncbi:hypothetical protein [Embleya sp. NPDC005575]|uniref:hypothetical protein n=1 Tax=Embleya sp. NPDC005575 TaxID=3156892 RepID=UPI0033A7E405
MQRLLEPKLPGAGGFIGGATTRPWVMAASVRKAPLDQKIRTDLRLICSKGTPVERVAFFAAYEVPVANRHGLQEHARGTHGVDLEILDGQAVSHSLSQAGLPNATWTFPQR